MTGLPDRRRLWTTRLRLAVWGVALVGLGYVALRFETTTLPEAGCSPLRAYAPGTRLLVDRWVSSAREGDVVLYRDPAGDSLLLGRVSPPPDVLPGEVAAELASGALWIEGDHPDCPNRDSRLLGPISADRLAGRVLLAL